MKIDESKSKKVFRVTVEDMYLPIVELFSDGKEKSTSVVTEHIRKIFDITDEEMKTQYDSGRVLVVNRVRFALSALKKAKIINRVSRSIYKITDHGIEFIKTTEPTYEAYRIKVQDGCNKHNKERQSKQLGTKSTTITKSKDEQKNDKVKSKYSNSLKLIENIGFERAGTIQRKEDSDKFVLISWEEDFDEGKCLYVVVKGTEVKYVGTTKHLANRFRTHCRNSNNGIYNNIKDNIDSGLFVYAMEVSDLLEIKLFDIDVDIAAGLEYGLIQKVSLMNKVWNKKFD